ncbi:MAG: methyl-accepting chemotaxis protein [Firmicutes bacterium]|nr:methyl-accepting chemotaxis protein [Bacillota bacterium]
MKNNYCRRLYMFLNNISISKKMILGFSYVLIIMLSITVITYKNFNIQEEANYWEKHTYEVIIEANELLQSLINMETSVRGFAITGQEEYLELYNMGEKDFDGHLANIKDLTSDDFIQQSRLNEIEKDKEQWGEVQVKPLLEARREVRDNDDVNINKVINIVNQGKGKESMDGIRELLAEVIGEEERLLAERDKRYDELAVSTQRKMIMGSLEGVISAIIIIFLLNRNIKKSIDRITEGITQVADGDLTKKIKVVGKDEMALISRKINEMIDNLNVLLKSVTSSSNIVLNSSTSLKEIFNQTANANDEVANTISEIANGASEQAKDVEEGVIQINGLGQDIENITKLSDEMDIASNKANSLTDKGMDAVETLTKKSDENSAVSAKVNDAVVKVNDSTSQIGIITDSINQIAEQTNLLALNASIEAARAGEAGKGFAVVADEIRKLAEESAKSVKDINEILQGIQSDSQMAVTSISEAKIIVDDQNDAVENTRRIFEEISASILDLINKISHVTNSSIEMNNKKEKIISMIERLSALSEESAAATEEVAATTEEETASIHQLSEHAEDLNYLSNELLDIVKKFNVE